MLLCYDGLSWLVKVSWPFWGFGWMKLGGCYHRMEEMWLELMIIILFCEKFWTLLKTFRNNLLGDMSEILLFDSRVYGLQWYYLIYWFWIEEKTASISIWKSQDAEFCLLGKCEFREKFTEAWLFIFLFFEHLHYIMKSFYYYVMLTFILLN